MKRENDDISDELQTFIEGELPHPSDKGIVVNSIETDKYWKKAEEFADVNKSYSKYNSQEKIVENIESEEVDDIDEALQNFTNCGTETGEESFDAFINVSESDTSIPSENLVRRSFASKEKLSHKDSLRLNNKSNEIKKEEFLSELINTNKDNFDGTRSEIVFNCEPTTHINEADCPVFEEFINNLTARQQSQILLILQIIGAILANDTARKRVLLLIGPLHAITMLLNLIKILVGAEFVRNFSFKQLFEQDKQPLLHDITLNDCGTVYELQKKYVYPLLKLSNNPLLSVKTNGTYSLELITTWFVLSGEDVIQAHRAVIETLANKILVLNFKNSTVKKGHDKEFLEEIKQELSIIADFAITTFEEMVESNSDFFQIEGIEDNRKYFVDKYSEVQEILDEFCVIDDTLESFMPTEYFYQMYCTRCADNKVRPLTEQQVRAYILENLGDVGVVEGRTKKGLSSQMRGFWGIRLT
ncbi:MAG: hypothetical protein FWF92_05880 [Oscillospiraceae bacterium]|nr:hypothetical protein [Oscillospiraceae bacterium]